MNVQKMTERDVAEELSQKGKTVVLDFYADWCGPCKMLAPVYEELAAELPDVVFGKVNVEEEAETAARYGVRSVPTVLVFRDGVQTAKTNGFVRKAALRETVLSVER